MRENAHGPDRNVDKVDGRRKALSRYWNPELSTLFLKLSCPNILLKAGGESDSHHIKQSADDHSRSRMDKREPSTHPNDFQATNRCIIAWCACHFRRDRLAGRVAITWLRIGSIRTSPTFSSSDASLDRRESFTWINAINLNTWIQGFRSCAQERRIRPKSPER
jgi:hypothetical protein